MTHLAFWVHWVDCYPLLGCWTVTACAPNNSYDVYLESYQLQGLLSFFKGLLSFMEFWALRVFWELQGAFELQGVCKWFWNVACTCGCEQAKLLSDLSPIPCIVRTVHDKCTNSNYWNLRFWPFVFTFSVESSFFIVHFQACGRIHWGTRSISLRINFSHFFSEHHHHMAWVPWRNFLWFHSIFVHFLCTSSNLWCLLLHQHHLVIFSLMS